MFLQNLIEETPDDLYLQPNQKDWDQQILLSQRSVQYTKRLQLLHKVKTLVKKFKEEAIKSAPEGEKVKGNILEYCSLLGRFVEFHPKRLSLWTKASNLVG